MNREKWDLLTNEELCLLYQQDTNNNKLFEYFLERNKNLMYKFIHKYIRKHPEYKDDIESLATIGMWDCMKEWNEEGGAKFSTLYHFHVLKALCKFYRQFYIIRIPAWKLNDPEAVEKALCMSLNIKLTYDDQDESELLEMCADESQMTGDQFLEEDLEHVQLYKALKTLDGRTQTCLEYYLGLRGPKRTLEEIGEIYGVTRERIRQIMVKGLKKLRNKIHLYLDTTGYTLDTSKPIHFGVCDARGDKFVRKDD
jgi:RNA polymerase sigma factor (sigma-70 family)